MIKRVAKAVPRELIESELRPEYVMRPTNHGGNTIYVIDAQSCPNIMREIGRLREWGFRDAGGGTGNDVDIDEDDLAVDGYKQLIVWDPDAREILGGYRFIVATSPKQKHLSTEHYFVFSDKFRNEYLPYTIELGRSFVHPDYQTRKYRAKGIYALDNLWDGLGTLTMIYPEAKYFFGKVTIGMPAFSTSLACAKAFYDLKTGYPDSDFFAAVHPDIAGLPQKKLMKRFSQHALAHPCQKVGELCSEMAQALGLCAGTVISAGHMDAYTPMAALGIDQPGIMMMILGTSTGIMLLSEEERPVRGVTASLPDTFFPGLWGYASGQASVGDGLQWFADHCVPGEYEREAEKQGLSVQQYLTQLAQKLSPGETGLLCLDWFNGNKSCLGNPRLSGMFLGLSLQTRPEHIYRAMLEATAFGARVIAETYRNAGVPVHEIRACGGIAGKNPLMMQIYADVLGMPISVSRCKQAPALGAAIYAAAAAKEQTGYPDVFAAVENMADRNFTVYTPTEQHQSVYEALYREYCTLHDYFGCGENRVMERLYHQRAKGGNQP